jgi:hypothetical protein
MKMRQGVVCLTIHCFIYDTVGYTAFLAFGLLAALAFGAALALVAVLALGAAFALGSAFAFGSGLAFAPPLRNGFLPGPASARAASSGTASSSVIVSSEADLGKGALIFRA